MVYRKCEAIDLINLNEPLKGVCAASDAADAAEEAAWCSINCECDRIHSSRCSSIGGGSRAGITASGVNKMNE